MKLLLAAVLAVAQCAPGTAKPDPTPTATVTVPDPPPPIVDAGQDPIALELCLENFAALNPCVPDLSCLSKAQLQAIFCATPEDLAPWVKQAAINVHPRALDAH